MSKNFLRAPLIKSAALLIVLTLIIYLTATTQDGGVFSSLGAIIYGIFKAIQLGIGLVLALLLCIAILIGIFLGGVAMVSTDSATKMYYQLLEMLSEKVGFIKLPIKKEKSQAEGVSLDALKASLQDEMAGHVESSVENVQRTIDEGMQDLQARVEQIETDDSFSVISDRLQGQEEKLSAIEEAVGSGTGEIQKLQEQLTALSQQLQDIQSEAGKADPTDKIATLEKSSDELKSLCSSLAEDVKSLQDELGALKTASQEEEQEAASEESEDEGEHRLFTYIEDQEEKEKISQLVTEGLNNDMTYAQIMEQLSEQTSEATATALDEHPSLTKDYIRHVKKTS